MKLAFIVWGREMELSRNLGNALGGEVRQIYHRKIFGLNMPAFFRYITQGMATFFYLIKSQPQIVYVQNPPVFAPLLVYVYCIFSGAKMAIDTHTAAFGDRKWLFFNFLFSWIAKKAILNTCHNYKNLEILKNWGVNTAMAVQFFNPTYDRAILAQPLKNGDLENNVNSARMPILMVNRFAPDDDIVTVVKTAELMPEATFFITGDINEGGETQKINTFPGNIFLVGYLQHQEFLKLMDRCKVILSFTLRPDTVLWSIREIMALDKPFVTTDSEVMKHYFAEVGLFVKSDPQELKIKIFEAMEREQEIKEKIRIFLIKDKARWATEIGQVKRILKIDA